jgi:hypothetical protein
MAGLYPIPKCSGQSAIQSSQFLSGKKRIGLLGEQTPPTSMPRPFLHLSGCGCETLSLAKTSLASNHCKTASFTRHQKLSLIGLTRRRRTIKLIGLLRQCRSKAGSTTVDSYLSELEHPLKGEVIALRALLLAVDSSITDEIIWNAPSFRTSEHFATLNLQGKGSLQLILHVGGTKHSIPAGTVSDPEGLLNWLASDRAAVSFRGVGDIAARGDALTAVIRQWIKHI